MIGKRFNKLLVLSIDRVEDYVNSKGFVSKIKYFNCRCDCGNEKIIRHADLYSLKSCGCQQTIANKLRTEDITGERFGRLTALYRDDSSGKWVCSCECGQQGMSKLATLRNGDCQSCGCLQKEKASISISNQHKEKRRSKGLPEDIPMYTKYAKERLDFKPLSSEIMKRDCYTCAWCSQKSGSLNVHHIETWINSPDLRFTRSNLVTLCVACHKKVHIAGNTTTDPIMTIVLQGYTNVVEEGYDFSSLELTPN